MDRQKALEFLHKYVTNEYQLHHAEMVETAMRAAAKHLSEDEDKFGFLGLIHDWDFDQWPSEHPGRYEQLQSELPEVDQEMVDTIKGHADLGFPRTTKLMQALLALDELSGLFYAYGRMVPKYADMKVSSINKKLTKELSFAAKINRQDILTGIQELGIPQDELIEIIRDAFAAKYD
jgi:predicted hydrolase (HD superfamily)